MDYAVVKGGGHVLIHCPSLLFYGHALQEEIKEGVDKSLDLLLPNLRKYSEAVTYLPNQVYIGNLEPEVLGDYDQPWWNSSRNIFKTSERFGPYGEIIPQDEFFALMKIVDVFDLVWLEKPFTAKITKKLKKHFLLSTFDLQKLGEGKEKGEIEEEIEKNKALALINIDNNNFDLIGCVRYAHKSDINLSAQVILENIASKASASLALKYALKNIDYNSEKIEYIIECSEEAIGDAFQRGGGNLAKSIGEVVGCNKATGSDLRAFCAAPVYGVLTAASHVSAATFKEIAVVAGGSLPKLGMNYKKLLEKKIPILEDCLAAIAIIVGRDDGNNPIIRHEVTGRYTIGRKTSPQEIMEALVSEPLAKLNKKITDIDKFAAELHNPEITVPAGAGDVAKANYRMIAALAVKKNEIKREEIDEFVRQKGMIGYVPTQGHIPSGVAFISFAREKMLEDKIDTSLIIGKGSLFLGRMTNLFDGVSLLLERNKPKKIQEREIVEDLDNEIKIRKAEKIKIAVSTFGYEHDIEEIISACEEILRCEEKIEPIIVGKENISGRVKSIKISDDLDINSTLNTLIDSGEIDGALAMHYTFELGVASVGK
ncbi:MAG: glycine reductase, partial [Actinobacteria bacterium]|nr:glycine reductase [Actinomycetota bacterium]